MLVTYVLLDGEDGSIERCQQGSLITDSSCQANETKKCLFFLVYFVGVL